jgi:hypothetical protein
VDLPDPPCLFTKAMRCAPSDTAQSLSRTLTGSFRLHCPFSRPLYCACLSLYCACLSLYCACLSLYCACLSLYCACLSRALIILSPWWCRHFWTWSLAHLEERSVYLVLRVYRVLCLVWCAGWLHPCVLSRVSCVMCALCGVQDGCTRVAQRPLTNKVNVFRKLSALQMLKACTCRRQTRNGLAPMHQCCVMVNHDSWQYQ